jgi:hypothetical protein
MSFCKVPLGPKFLITPISMSKEFFALKRRKGGTYM